jgi:hypothetical protein
MSKHEQHFIFDSDALEKLLAEGTQETHDIFSKNTQCEFCLNSATKRDFLDCYAVDQEKLEAFRVVKKVAADNQLAASYSDSLQNLPDIDLDEVQNKIKLVAMAVRAGCILVTGEGLSIATRIKVIAESVGAECLNTDEFISLFY